MDWIRKRHQFWHCLWLSRHHCHNLVAVLFLSELYSIDIVKAFSQMRLHCMRVARLRKDFDELVVRKKVEPRKRKTLCLQIILQALLNVLQQQVVLLKLPQQFIAVANFDHHWLFIRFVHNVLPEFINAQELLSFRGQLLLNVLSSENIFEVHPLSLALQPFVQNFADQHQLFFPLFDLSSNGLDVPCSEHRLDWHLMIIQILENFLNGAQHELILCLSIRVHNKAQFAPFQCNLLNAFLDLRLTGGTGGDLFNLILLAFNSVCN